ncbi:MAG: carbon monoxide dehydrogenase protein [Labilithrix sp.]|nr:carbon monoxide dehydrogenase protein [Labilithrix sp.]
MDARAALRLTDELLWVLRREGLAIATSQAIDAVRALRLVGFDSREDVREALAAVIVTRPSERARFDRAFEAFFSRSGHRRTFWERLESKGFSSEELDVLRALLDQIATSSSDGAIHALLGRGAELDRLLHLAGTSRLLEAMQSPLQAGFYTHRLLDRIGANAARSSLGALRPRLVDALGEPRAAELAAALEAELSAASDDVRSFVRETLDQRERDSEGPRDLMSTPFTSLDDAEIEEVRRAVRRFVQRLRGGERVRRRRSRKGRVDAHRTLRAAMRTDGVPFGLARRTRKRDKPKLVIVCDVSESVRSVARFLLELAYAAQELFAGTRTFVFVSELGETTRLFEDNPVETALARAYSGAVVPVTHNSNYGRAFRAFEQVVVPELDRRTTVVILGDGRTNYLDPAAEVLDAIRARARALVWLCPEPRAAWATGDSAMPRYAPRCTSVLEVRCARDLEDAARLLVTLR